MEKKTLADQGIKVGEKAIAKPLTRFTMVKNYRGGMAVMLEAEDFSTPIRRIDFKYDTEEKIIPLKWAIGTFVSDSAMRQMEKGFFSFKELDELIAMAEGMGHYVPDSIKAPKITLRELRKIVKANNLGEIKRLFPGFSKKDKHDLVAMGKQLYNKLNMSVIQYIEKELKVSLQTVDLSPPVDE